MSLLRSSSAANAANVEVMFEDKLAHVHNNPATFHVTAYYAPQFAQLRSLCIEGGDEAYVTSLARCKKWAAKGGTTRVYFARTLDERYVIKQLQVQERTSFLEFAPEYFKYMAQCIEQPVESLLAKIFGVYRVNKRVQGKNAAST